MADKYADIAYKNIIVPGNCQQCNKYFSVIVAVPATCQQLIVRHCPLCGQDLYIIGRART